MDNAYDKFRSDITSEMEQEAETRIKAKYALKLRTANRDLKKYKKLFNNSEYYKERQIALNKPFITLEYIDEDVVELQRVWDANKLILANMQISANGNSEEDDFHPTITSDNEDEGNTSEFNE